MSTPSEREVAEAIADDFFDRQLDRTGHDTRVVMRGYLAIAIVAALAQARVPARIGPCDVCWCDAWEPVETEAECALVHPHRAGKDHVRCGYCWLREQFDRLRARVEPPATQALREAAQALLLKRSLTGMTNEEAYYFVFRGGGRKEWEALRQALRLALAPTEPNDGRTGGQR